MNDQENLMRLVDALIPLTVPAPFQALARSQAMHRIQSGAINATETLRVARAILRP